MGSDITSNLVVGQSLRDMHIVYLVKASIFLLECFDCGVRNASQMILLCFLDCQG